MNDRRLGYASLAYKGNTLSDFLFPSSWNKIRNRRLLSQALVSLAALAKARLWAAVRKNKQMEGILHLGVRWNGEILKQLWGFWRFPGRWHRFHLFGLKSTVMIHFIAFIPVNATFLKIHNSNKRTSLDTRFLLINAAIRMSTLIA